MRKEYLEPTKTNDTAKTLKYLKSVYKLVNENNNKFENNKYILKMLKNNNLNSIYKDKKEKL